jgi:Ca2+-binding EF-hand superfamily protein
MMTMKSLYKATMTLGFALLAATAANAQAGSTDIWSTNFQKAFMTEKMMHMMDMSHKGMVTRDDYNKYMGKVFDKMDKKHRGMLDKDDFLAVEAGSTDIWTTDFQKTFRTEDMMHMMDKSGKGMVSKADFMKHMNKIFDMLDKDHNGMLEENEFMYDKVFSTNK